MPLTRAQLEAIANTHCPESWKGRLVCAGCPGRQVPWPCDAARLVAPLLGVDFLTGRDGERTTPRDRGTA